VSSLPSLKEVTEVYAVNPMLFPSSGLWLWRPIYEKGVIGAGQTKEIYDRRESGWINHVTMVCTNPDLKLCIDLEADGKIEIRISPRTLKYLGAVQRCAGVFNLLVYDDSTPLYIGEYAPVSGGLGIPFRGRNRAWIENPSNVPVSFEVSVWLAIVKEPATVLYL